MNKLSLVSLAAVAACSGAPVIKQSAPEVGVTQGKTQRQALTAIGENHAGWRNNGDFIYCTQDSIRATNKNLVDKGLLTGGADSADSIERTTRHYALMLAGDDSCYMMQQDKEKELQRSCASAGSPEDFQEEESPEPSTFSIPVYCDDLDRPTYTCTSSLIIKDIGRNDTGDDVCVRVGVEKTELIPATSQTPLPEAPESN